MASEWPYLCPFKLTFHFIVFFSASSRVTTGLLELSAGVSATAWPANETTARERRI
jgi:hypothetical protein